MEGLVELHDNIMFYLIIILFGVGWILTSVIRNYASTRSPISHKYLNHGTMMCPYTINKIKPFPGNTDPKLETSRTIGSVARIQIRLLHFRKNNNKLNPNYITGFAEYTVFSNRLMLSNGRVFKRYSSLPLCARGKGFINLAKFQYSTLTPSLQP